MATLTDPDEDTSIQDLWDQEFSKLTSPEHMAKDGVPGDTGSGEGGGFFNPTDEQTSGGKSASPNDLSKAEQEGSGTSLFNKDDTGGRLAKAKSKLKSLAKNKWLVGGAIGGGGGVALIIILLVLLVGSLKIPDFAQHVAEWQFARVARNYSEQTSEVTAEDTALATANDSALKKAAAQLASVRDATWGSMWDKINNYRPNKILDQLESDEVIKYNYAPRKASNLWQKKLESVTINGKEIDVGSSAWNKIFHPLQARSDRLAASADLNEQLAIAMKGRSVIIRGAVAKELRDRIGVALKWWRQPLKYSGEDQEEAAATQEAEATEQIDEGNTAPSEIDNVADAEKTAQDELKSCAADIKCEEDVVERGGSLPTKALNAVREALTDSVFHKALNFLNPAYAVALPVCLIYDGSLQNPNSGEQQRIDDTDKEKQRAFYGVESAADQQKYGDTTAEAVGAMNWKLGNITESVAEQRATSGDAVDTSGQVSFQAGESGSLTNEGSVFDTILPGPAAAIANALAPTACKIVNNLLFGGAIAIGSIGLGFLTGGGEEAASEGVGSQLASYLGDVIGKALEKKELLKLGLVVAGTSALTVFAQHLTASKAAVDDGGVAAGPAFDNDADEGGDADAQETSRLFYGRPFTNAETAQASQNDRSYQNEQLNDAGFTERYFALSNPDSLASRVGLSLSGSLNGTIVQKVVGLLGDLLTPLASLVHMVGSLNSQVTMAAASQTDNYNYGILQWGWSNDEVSLMANGTSQGQNMADPDNYTYQPIENQAAYEGSRFCIDYQWYPSQQCLVWYNYADILPDLYAKCFEYTPDGKINDSDTMGYMLTPQDDNGGKPYILRDKDGNIEVTDPSEKFFYLDQGQIGREYITVNGVTHLKRTYFENTPQNVIKYNPNDGDFCNPTELSYNNPENFNDPEDDFPPNTTLNDLVFRYRLEKSYELTVDQLEAVQNSPSNNDPAQDD